MSENKKTQSFQDDEFDIEVLASKLWSINKKIFAKIWYPVVLVKSNPRKLIIALTVSVLVSVILRYTIPPVYESSFIIKPHNPTDQVSMAMLTDLNILLKDENYEDIAKKLRLDKGLCEQLKKLSYYPIYKSEFRKDTITGIFINLLMFNPRLIDTFQQAIIQNYLEESDYFKRYIRVRQEELDYMENLLLKDINENDSLKHLVAANMLPRNGGGFVFGEPLDPQKIHQSGFDLQQQLMKVRINKEYNQSFSLAKSGLVRLKPYFPRLIILLPICICIALIYCAISNYKTLVPSE